MTMGTAMLGTAMLGTMMLGTMTRRTLKCIALVVAGALLAGGCSSGPGLTTGSLFGGASKAATPAAPPDNNTPTGRALHVGTTAARAAKCGYNFDAASLRANYIASEAGAGLPIADLARVEQIYDTGYRGIMNAAATENDYCNSKRTAGIKAALTKVLAADYSPPPPVVEADAGVLGGFFDSDVEPNKGPSFGSGDWWDAQRDNKSK